MSSRIVQRGQATVELALGITLFVTVLMLGIHFAEIGVLQLKVHEAANFALFQGTGQRVHHFVDSSANFGGNGDGTYDPDNDYATRMGDYSQGRYDDWEGRNGIDNGPWTLALTTTQPMSVTCNDNGPTRFTIPAGGGGDAYYDDVRDKVRDYYQDRGHAQCWSQARVSSIRIPTHYSEAAQGGHYTAAHWDATPWTVCGVGRANGSSCTGRFSMLLGDWSLDGTLFDQNNQSRVYAGGWFENDHYREMIQTLWRKNGKARGDAASRFAAQLGNLGVTPLADTNAPFNDYDGENQFFMSFAGTEYGYKDNTTNIPWYLQRDTAGIWPATKNDTSDGDRNFCYLGRGC